MHRWSQLFIPTLREAPADAEVASHKFLLRAGYVRQLAAGIYSYLFLGQRTILKITRIVRGEMDKIGQEFFLPALNPREIWEASGRWSVMGDNMFRLKDRKGADLCLGMTHEEVMTDIARKELRSYKQLPQIWYQIQTKFRDEPRPKSGLLRVRQFTMKDAYSFDIDAAGLDVSYKKHYDTYNAIFNRCGLEFVAVQAHSGAMGGSQSHEFMVYTEAGEDFVASCAKCGYAANLEKASSQLEPVQELEGGDMPEEIHTPNIKTIDELSNFLEISPKNQMKTLCFMAVNQNASEGQAKEIPVIVFVRGDHTLNEAKLATTVPGADFRPMHPSEVSAVFGAFGGSLGAIGSETFQYKGVKAKVFLDLALRGRKNLVTGANKEDYHLRNVTPGRHFKVEDTQWADFRSVQAGEGCPNCGEPLKVAKAVEIGHIFKLGYKYSESMGARVLDKDGKEVTPVMGSYGIGIERILTSSIEQNHDDDGFWLPPNIAPFEVVVVPTNVKDELISKTAGELAARLEGAGYDVVLDDRDERPGVKFKDADLVGIPLRITVGKKVSEGKVEVFRRSTRTTQDANIGEIVEVMQTLYRPNASH
ncbi:MAG: proline--tRNA ligase [Acidobacteriaceae bacterium]